MIRVVDLAGISEVDDLDEAVVAEERSPPGGRPWVIVNMVGSVDGATAVEGGATGLTDADDQRLFMALRGVADVVVVGATTVRAEDYGPVRLCADVQQRRAGAGRSSLPPLAVLTSSLALDPEARMFGGPTPYVFTGSRAPDHLVETMKARAEVVISATDRVDVTDVLARLWRDGHRVVLCEGGPTVNGQFFAAGLVDEIDVTVAPMVVGGSSSRLVHHREPFSPPVDLRLDRLYRGDRSLFARYVTTST